MFKNTLRKIYHFEYVQKGLVNLIFLFCVSFLRNYF